MSGLTSREGPMCVIWKGFAEAALQGRHLGFDGKSLIHPKTVRRCSAAIGAQL
jgi:hypothetical protein